MHASPPVPVPKAPGDPERQRPSAWRDLGEGGRNLGFEDFPTFVVGRLFYMLQKTITSEHIAPSRLTPPEWRILAALAAYSTIGLTELVKLSMSDKGLVSRSLQRLCQLGYAQTRPDPQHRKKVVCDITAAGRVLYEELMPGLQQAQAGLISVLDEEERVALLASLNKLRRELARRLDGACSVDTDPA